MPEFATARQRINEYLRQRKGQKGLDREVIHNSFTDPNAAVAPLLIADLEEVMQTSTGLDSWTYFYAFHAAFSVLRVHEAWTMGPGEDLNGTGKFLSHKVTCVGCPAGWHTYALSAEDARELFTGHQANVVATRLRDSFQNPDKAEEQQLILDRVWHEGWDANDGDTSPYQP
ncbi:hypothetical protein HYP71_gp067 [Arthrobacter phage KBurrousTX]|uniref:Uncharacterized protein n=1 Tax=Arthrobacter phage KBurrousTX TaxID=2315608 RepID=A0A386K8C7_9CAUD|nr:hypothetical protein HYP71_gp067 [Arthrobacter phage KBurrousTX]AYD81561.1 hypothetical protein KBurrousTX_67 [Arthrobacter phage KBurrousTX]